MLNRLGRILNNRWSLGLLFLGYLFITVSNFYNGEYLIGSLWVLLTALFVRINWKVLKS